MENNIGLGLGLQATSNTARDLYATGEQAKYKRALMEFQKKKEDDEDFAKLTKDVSLNPGYEWHRLLTEEAIAASAEKVDALLKAKSSGDSNWKNVAAKVTKDYNAKMTRLVSLNEQYKAFDEQTKEVNQGSTYTPTIINNAWKAFNESKDRFELQKNFEKYGVQNDNRGYLAYNPDGGDIKIRIPEYVNIDQKMKSLSDVIPPVLTVSQRVWSGDKYVETNVKQKPLTRAQAEEEYNKNKSIYPNGIPASLEDAADAMLSDPDFMFQYADKKGLPDTDPMVIKESLMDEMAQYNGLKQTQKFGQKSKGLTVNVWNNQETGNKAEPTWTFDSFQSPSQLNPAGPLTEVSYVGAYQPQLPNPSGAIKDSVYDAFGNKTNAGPSKNFPTDSKFTGFFMMPYYENANGDKVPWSAATPTTEKLEGFTYFGQYQIGSTGLAYQSYDKFMTSANAIIGSDKEVASLLNNANKQMSSMMKQNYAKISSIPVPTATDWNVIKSYTQQVAKKISEQ